MTAAAAAMSSLMLAHRSIREYTAQDIDNDLLERLLAEAFQGSSSSGNLNMSSVVVTRDVERKRQLCTLHGGQPMVLQAPVVLTFCADTQRTRTWLAQRNARLGFADFLSWHVASFDAIIFAQTAALALEAHGLGICYMGTTLYAMRDLAELLELPGSCLPVTSLVVGWPAEAPGPRDRLPATAWLHRERYQPLTPEKIDADYAARDERGWARYRSMGPEVIRQMEAHGITSLAQFYTSKIKYDPDNSAVFSADLEALLRERGFFGAAD